MSTDRDGMIRRGRVAIGMVLALGALRSVYAMDEIASADYRVTMPDADVRHTQEPARTPWGRATRDVYFATDTAGITYVFFAYTFQRRGHLAPERLGSLRDDFLKTHKCAARDLREQIRTGDGHTWPQQQFGGSCAAGPGGYRILSLIANDKLFQLQVTDDPAVGTRAGRTDMPMLRELDLGQALQRFAGDCRLDSAGHDNAGRLD
jgi:hypothetical protein